MLLVMLMSVIDIIMVFNVPLDYNILNSDIKSKLISIFCMDAVYGTLVQYCLEVSHSCYLEITIQNTLQPFAWYK